MFRRCRGSAVAAVLLAAGCGGGRTSSPPITEPGASVTTPSLVPSTTAAVEVTTPESAVPASTETASTGTSTTSTVALQPVADLAVLRPGGLGDVDFGTPADETVLELTALFGPPDRVEELEPIGPGGDGCVELGSWLDCLRERRVVDEGRLAVWDDWGLRVALVDTAVDHGPAEQTALQFADWHATFAPGNRRPVTLEGLRPGMTVRDLRQVVPGVEFGYNEGLLDSFFVTAGDPGWYWGRLDWNPSTDDIEYWDVSAIQAALNEHGANLVVDGEWGPLSEAAWLEFLTNHGIEPFTLAAKWPLWLMPEIGEALGLPPDDITIATLEPRPATEIVDPAATSTDGAGPTFATVPDSDLSLDQILGQRETWMISNSNYATYSIEPCWTRDTDETPPYGIFQAAPVDLTAVVGGGDVFICSIRTEPVGEPGNLLLAVLTDDGLGRRLIGHLAGGVLAVYRPTGSGLPGVHRPSRHRRMDRP